MRHGIAVYRKKSFRRGLVLLCAFASLSAPQLEAQALPLPKLPLPTLPHDHTSDPAALAEITAFQTASSLSLWTGIEAIGTVILPGSDTPANAKLWISAGGFQRLDIAAPTGQRSVRMLNGRGVTLTDGKPDSFLDQDLTFAGLAQLPALLPALYKDLALTAKDQSLYSLKGVGSVHRLTLLLPTDRKAPSTLHPDHLVDLYFDPIAHLLVKSVALVHLFGPASNQVALTTDYADYRLVGTSLAPFSITQTIDGQPYWTIRLTSATPLIKQDPSLFTYKGTL